MFSPVQCNIHKSIYMELGPEGLKRTRILENTSRKIARFRNHLHFSLHCKHHSITPVSLKVSTTVKRGKAEKIINTTEKALLNVRISQIHRTLTSLETQKIRAKENITEILHNNESLKSQVYAFTEQAQQKEHEICKFRQIKKFHTLQRKTTNHGRDKRTPTPIVQDHCCSKWVKNFSNRDLNATETRMLSKGLNFAVTSKKIPVVEIVTAVESACLKLNKSDADDLRSSVNNIFKKQRSPNTQCNLSEEEQQALQDLRKDRNIKILPADKGRCTVLLNTDDYKNKCKAMLNDEQTYMRLKRDPTPTYKKELVSSLQELKEKGATDTKLYRKIYPTTDAPPRFYGLPKIHKEGVPLCPIVSTVNTITYQCAKTPYRSNHTRDGSV